MLKIVSAPSSVLSEPAKQVSKIDKSVLDLIDEMKETLNATHDPEGVGLAAPQVGKPLQIFLIKPSRRSRIEVFINPKIINLKKAGKANTKDNNHVKLEGCLSLPNIWGEVDRPDEVAVRYLDEKGQSHKRSFKGFPATIIQHEYDHLQGNLFPKRVLEQKKTLYKSHRNEKGEDVFEEVNL